MYTLHTSPCFGNDYLDTFDNLYLQGLSSILNIDLKDRQWLQASLPVKAGGLGIRSASSLALPAFLASAAGSSSLALQILPSHLCTNGDPKVGLALSASSATSQQSPAPVDTAAFKQKSWDSIIIQKTQDSLLSESQSDYDSARLHAAFSKGSCDWLNAVPL